MGDGASDVDVCVVGSFMADMVVRAPRRPDRGETVIGTSCDLFLGGKGFNQAVAAARAGARTAMVGALGDDEHGHRFVAALASEGIDAAGVHTLAGAGTGIAFPVVEDSGENSIIIVPRANHLLAPADLDGDLIGRAAVVLVQLELPVDVVVAAAAAAHRAGATVILNPAPAIADPAAFAGLIDIVVPNESELALLTGGGADLAAAAAHLRASTGAHSVVVTLGDRGVHAWTPDGDITAPAHVVDTIDTVGAGDAFCGVLAARLAAGAGLADAVRHANSAGALATTRSGAEPAMPTREAVESLLAWAAAR